ncbi:helix-turn-helix domain-containing protein [Lachnospiraceae bacterium 54-53]
MENHFASITVMLEGSIGEVIHGERELSLSSFALFKGRGEKCFESCLYLANAGQLPPAVPEGLSALILVPDEPIPEAYRSLCVIRLNKEADILGIVSRLQETFPAADSSEGFMNRLLKVTNSPRSVQQLLDLGYQELGNPLLLVDVSLCFVAHSGGGQITDEPLWDWTLKKGYVTEEYVKYVMGDDGSSSGFPEEGEETSDSRLIWQKGLLHHSQLVGKVISGGVPLGYLKLLEYNQPITREASEKLLILCHFLALCMDTSREPLPRKEALVETFLTSMLTQRLYEKNAIEERVNRFRLKLYDNLHVIVAGTHDLITDRVYFFKKKLKNFLVRETIVLFQGNLVILYDHKEQAPFSENELTNFRNLCGDFGVRAGISNGFTEVQSFEAYYRQALTSLELGEETKSSDPVAFYRDFYVLHMVSLFAQHNDPRDIIQPAVFLLRNHDLQYGSEFCDTLMKYLENNQNMALTADMLNIHYNTLKYRIRRMAELTGLDLTDNGLLFHLRLSFLILDYLAKTGRLL